VGGPPASQNRCAAGRDRRTGGTTAFHNAVNRLASDKIEERLGGIYILERVARDSLNDHWPVMETLTAFVRARATWKEPATTSTPAMVRSDVWRSGSQPDVADPAPTIDIAAVLTVIGRRSEAGRKREQQHYWQLDLRGTDLGGADLRLAHLERAYLVGAHFERTFLFGARLEGASLTDAHLEGAHLDGVWTCASLNF
jgi:hypothetical protein